MGFDVVHCHGIFPPEISYWAAVHSPAPVVVTFHTYRPRRPALVPLIFRRAFSGLLSRVRARIAVSEAARRYSEQWFPGIYHVIPNGVDMTRFRPDAPPPESMRSTDPTVLFVGRLDERKGLVHLIHAVARVKETVSNIRLVVAGTGPQESRCRTLVRRLGLADHVRFAGRVSDQDLPGYYAGCTAFCSPAMSGEAMGIVLVEALACGRPVVASDIDGYREVIHDGTDGLLARPADPDALARRLVEVLTSASTRERLSIAALERARAFAWPAVTTRIETVYHEVAT